jgi:hypothetical protein
VRARVRSQRELEPGAPVTVTVEGAVMAYPDDGAPEPPGR